VSRGVTHYRKARRHVYPVYLCIENFIKMFAGIMRWDIEHARAHVHREIREGRYDPYHTEPVGPSRPWRVRSLRL